MHIYVLYVQKNVSDEIILRYSQQQYLTTAVMLAVVAAAAVPAGLLHTKSNFNRVRVLLVIDAVYVYYVQQL